MNQQETRKCCRCGEYKPLKKFQKRSNSKDGLAPYCKRCAKKIQNLHRRNALTKPAAITMYNIMKEYDIIEINTSNDIIFWKFLHETNYSITDRSVILRNIINSNTGKVLFESTGRQSIKMKEYSIKVDEILRRYNRK